LQLRARRGDKGIAPYIRGYTTYQNDPIGFCQDHLKSTFTDEIKKVIESVRDNPVTIAVSANGVGKSFAAARTAVWFYKAFPQSQVYTSAAPPEKNLKKILWGQIGSLVHDLPFVFTEDKINEDMNIQRESKSFITGVIIPSSGTPEQREAKFSGRHAPYLFFIVDEADAVPPEVFKGIESCMSGGHARLLIMFNPRADRGVVANMVKNKQGHVIHLSAFDHPNVLTGKDLIPGAVTRQKTVERINEMSDALAPGEKRSIECFEVPNFLVDSVAIDKAGKPYPPLSPGWRHVRNPEFFYKVLGIYPPQSETQLISRAWTDAAVSRWTSYVARYGEVPPPTTLPVLGLDVADMGADKNKLLQRWGGWVPRLRGWGGVDPDMTAIKAVEIIKELNVPLHAINVFVDGTGVGAGVAPRMNRLGIPNATRVMVASSPTYKTEMGEFYQLRDQLWWSAMLWLKNDPGAMLPPNDELIDELLAPTYWTGERDGKLRVSSKETMIESLGRSPDSAEALVLSFAPAMPVAGAFR